MRLDGGIGGFLEAHTFGVFADLNTSLEGIGTGVL